MKLRAFSLCLLVALPLLGIRAADAPRASVPDSAGNTPLHLAALRSDADAVDALLGQGADPNATNDAGATPLHYGTGSERIVSALLAKGAKADAVTKIGSTPLLIAVARPESFGVAQRLIAAGANVNASRVVVPGGPARSGSGPLSLAIAAGDRRMIDLLLEHKANPDPQQGLPPLAVAAQMGDVETVRRLLDLGANIDRISGNAGSALNLALFSNQTAVARLLLERGANPHLKSPRGYATPAMVLSGYHQSGDATIARMLVARNLDVNTTDDAGETALGYALKNSGDSELVQFLKSAGAKLPPETKRAKPIPSREVPADPAVRTALVRESAQRAVDLMQLSSTAFLENPRIRDQAKCISCHQQSLPAVAFGWARERGLRVNEQEIGRQLVAKFAARETQTTRGWELEQPVPGAAVALGFDADGLEALRYPSDEMMQAMSHYLMAIQQRDGSWAFNTYRPPMEDGPLIATAWSVRAVQLYPPANRGSEVESSLRRAREWLAARQPVNMNERIFQLLGLAWANETPPRMRPLAEALIAAQRADGGWTQLPGRESDSWATGAALVALHKAGIATTHPAYARGVEFLLRTQYDDGSWWVKSRAWPFQPHFDGKFPHGRDQWISAAGTAWATMALLLTLEPTVAPESLPNARQLMERFARTTAASETTPASRREAAMSSASVDFARDIRPLFQRSCADCHTGERPKGGFSLATREGLLLGGLNREPAIVPGHAEKSDLFRYVSDKVEDLEMPPLDRRDKYPALTSEEIARLRAWIDAGATWPAAAGSL